MQKRKTIVKLSFIFAAVILGLILTFVPFKIPGTFSKYKSFAGSIKLGIDLKGGVYALYDVADDESDENLDARIDGTVARLLTMLNGAGYMEATVSREGDTRIRAEVPDVENPTALFDLIGEPAELEFRIEGNTLVWGKNVTDAYVTMYEGKYAVQLVLDSQGTTDFSNATSGNVGKAMDIVINGTVISSPNIQAAISNGKPVITGEYTYQSADDLAKRIVSGALGVKLELKESNVISATLGANALSSSMLAGGIGVLCVILFLMFFYRGMGVCADIALLIFTVLYIFFLSVFPFVQLTLPGIAGIILSLGMAVDANVVIFERIRDEYRLGKSPRASVNSGFKKAFWAIFDSNITTVMASVVLIILGRGTVQGFGITLLIGVLFSMFTGLIVTRWLLKQALILFGHKPKLLGLLREENVSELPDAPDDEGKKKSIAIDKIQTEAGYESL